MTRTEMLAHARMILDESSAAHWTDAQIYDALAQGQNAVISLLVKGYFASVRGNLGATIPSVLLPIIKNSETTGFSGTYISRPSGFYEIISMRASKTTNTEADRIPVRRLGMNPDIYFMKDNQFLGGSGELYFWLGAGSRIDFSFTFSNGSYDFYYIELPDAISASTDPNIAAISHDAIVFYAVSDLFAKEQGEKVALQQIYFQKFLTIVQQLMV